MPKEFSHMSRRAFLRRGTLFLLAAASGTGCATRRFPADRSAVKPVLRIGLLTDVHHADIPPAGTRFYRESISKIRESIRQFNEVRADFVVELGDFIDAADTAEGEIQHLHTIDREYQKFSGDRHYVLGNHCVWSLTKEQFLDNCGARKEFYSFDREDFHFVLLDACYRQDGASYGAKNFDWTDTEIPPSELDWLKNDLNSTSKKTIAFVHQRLDVRGDHGVKNAEAVRRVLEGSGKVVAVFQGHNHINDYGNIGGIHYCTLKAMIEGSGKENSAYAVLKLYEDASMRVDGFRKQADYSWNPSMKPAAG